MLSLDKNPFVWNERGNISGTIGALSLVTRNGSNIPVKNLNEDIEVGSASVPIGSILSSFVVCEDSQSSRLW